MYYNILYLLRHWKLQGQQYYVLNTTQMMRMFLNICSIQVFFYRTE